MLKRRSPQQTCPALGMKLLLTEIPVMPGRLVIAGRTAQASLYDHALATYEEGDAFQHGAAAGFIHVWSLGTKTWAAATQADTVGV